MHELLIPFVAYIIGLIISSALWAGIGTWSTNRQLLMLQKDNNTDLGISIPRVIVINTKAVLFSHLIQFALGVWIVILWTISIWAPPDYVYNYLELFLSIGFFIGWYFLLKREFKKIGVPLLELTTFTRKVFIKMIRYGLIWIPIWILIAIVVFYTISVLIHA